MKHYFIINPAAGKGMAADFLNEKIRQSFAVMPEEYQIYVTKGVGDAILFVRERCETEQEDLRFYACGGDGTLCEVANGAAGALHASITSIPCGSGNDFVRNFTGDFRELVKLLHAEEKPIDLMKFQNGMYGVNMCNAGFDANVALNMGKFKSLPLVNGHMAYQLSLVYCLLKKMFYHLRVVLDGSEVIEGEFLFTTVGNGCYCGGGFKGVPEAVIDDGLLDLCVVKKMSRLKFLTLVNTYKEGKHLQDPSLQPYVCYRKAKRIEISSDQPFAVSVDGESSLQTRIFVEVEQGALRFFSPETKEKSVLCEESVNIVSNIT